MAEERDRTMEKDQESHSLRHCFADAISYNCMTQELQVTYNSAATAPLCVFGWVYGADPGSPARPPAGAVHEHVNGMAGTYTLSDAAFPMGAGADYYAVVWETNAFSSIKVHGNCPPDNCAG